MTNTQSKMQQRKTAAVGDWVKVPAVNPDTNAASESPALVCAVNEDGTVTLAVFGPDGTSTPRERVDLAA